MLSKALQLSVLATVGVGISASASVGPTLQSRLARGSGQVQVVITLESSPSAIVRALGGRPSAAAETRTALESDNRLLLEQFRVRAKQAGIDLKDPQEFWLSPAVAATVPATDVAAIDGLDGVASVIEDAPLELIDPVRETGATAAYDATAAGMDLVGVRSLWRQGLTGKGTLIASLDTGVDPLHPALAARYRGTHAPAAQTWRDPEGHVEPDDPDGHGTHTMGTVLGCEPGDTVGIAPEAEWIAAGVVDRGQTFSQTVSDLLGAFEWLADPDGNPATQLDRPDVVLNSWGIPQGVLPVCDATFWQVVDHLEALGTVVIFAAGNEGPGPSTLRQPADRGDSYLSCFAVGAVDAMDPASGAAHFSSRGPSACNPIWTKPELVAPGVNVRSCAKGGGYKTLTGTSMAAPYVAGAVCLLRQYNPDATAFEIKQAIVRSAQDIGDPGPDFATGFGLLDIAAALQSLGAAKPVSWRLSVPEVAELSENAQAQVDLVLENLGGSLAGVTIDVKPLAATTTLLSNSKYFVDHVDGEAGRLDLPLSFVTSSLPQTGDRLWFELNVATLSPMMDTTIRIGVKVGALPGQAAMTVSAHGLSVVATNTGRFDLAQAEIISVVPPEFGFDGLTIPISGGLEITTPYHVLSSFGDANSFEPAPGGQLVSGSDATLSQCRIRDTRYANPAGVELVQRVYAGEDGPGAYMLLDYAWTRLWDNHSAVQMGSWYHWQPVSGSEVIKTGLNNEICERGDGVYFGCLWLSTGNADQSLSAYSPESNSLPGFVPESQPEAASSYWSRFREDPSSASSGHFVLAFVAAHTFDEWQTAASRARAQFAVASGTGQESVRPDEFRLESNYPNPFNPSTQIRFTLMEPSMVRLDIYNSLGRHVSTLVNGNLASGLHQVSWQGQNDQGLPMPSGVYFIRVTAGDQVRTGKMSLLR